MSAKVQIQIVTWNSRKYLNRLFCGIQNQKGLNFNVLIIDNASEDGTKEEIIRLTSQTFGNFIPFRIINNNTNKGFAKAHNQGFKISNSPYVLVLNPDTELQENFLQECVNMIESDKQIASVGGVLYQKLPEKGKNGIIDSLGLKKYINGQIVDIGQNTSQNANFSPKIDVFGISGACALYRLNALKQVKDKYGIFDERFGSYKEDADLAWRLFNAKFKAKIALNAIAYHARGVGKLDVRKNRSNEIKQASIRNHILMLKKNLKWYDWRIGFVIGYEFVKFIYIVLFERKNLKLYKALWTSL